MGKRLQYNSEESGAKASTEVGRDILRNNPINAVGKRKTMGILKLTIAVGSPQRTNFEEVEVTVDTGFTYTALPRDLLEQLGVPVDATLPSETAD